MLSHKGKGMVLNLLGSMGLGSLSWFLLWLMPLKNNLHCYKKLFQISHFPEIAKIFGFINYGYVFCLSAVPIIPVYLDVTEIPTTRPQIAANSTSNKTFATVSPSTVIDSSMDLKIGALFASKAFVQVCSFDFNWTCKEYLST